nr:hypothetical protein NNDYNQYS_NNDYNQYS_CDS_0005 [Microvirus sp.]CAI9752244.1 hypothetical protein HGHZXEWH_HGHZXEWH_CDS_0005 [Microvirus sp.]
MKIIVLNHSKEEIELLEMLLHSALADKNGAKDKLSKKPRSNFNLSSDCEDLTSFRKEVSDFFRRHIGGL